jgi:recombination protein RecA
MGDHHVGLQARLMSQALRKLTAAVSKSRCVIIFINQIRMKIGVLFGNPETTTGGNALKFYSTLRIEVRRTESLKKGAALIGARTRAKIVKNKVAPPFRETMFDIIFGKGINKTASLLDCAVLENVVEKSGSWYSYKGEKIGQGRESSCDFLEENRGLLTEIDEATRKSLGLIKPEKQGGEEKGRRKSGSEGTRKLGRGRGRDSG